MDVGGGVGVVNRNGLYNVVVGGVAVMGGVGGVNGFGGCTPIASSLDDEADGCARTRLSLVVASAA